jgi:hypothetical protein
VSNLFNSDPGSSKSTSSQTTTSIDGRVVGGDSSTNFSLNGNTAPVTINTTDAGAIHDSLALALAGVEGANTTTGAALSAVQAGQAQFTSAIEQIKTGDKTTAIVIGGVVLVAIAVAYAMSHRKG